MINIELLRSTHPEQWLLTGEDPVAFVRLLSSYGYITWQDADEWEALYERAQDIEQQPGPVDPKVWEDWWTDWRQATGTPALAEPGLRERIGGVLFDKIAAWFTIQWKVQLAEVYLWLYDNIAPLLKKVWDPVAATVNLALEAVNAKLEDIGRRTFDGLSRLMQESGPITPERAPAFAMKLYSFAFSMGIAAHGVAMGFELLYPLKRLGLHTVSAMISDFAGYGRIAGATMGVMTSVALSQPMRYAVNELTRPVIPDDRLLIELRSKREIDKPDFDKAMGYQGFSNKWIDVIERWQWKDPRMFELMRVADIGIEQGPPPPGEMWWFKKFGITGDKLKDWWLYRKLMRAGYEDVDLDVLIRTIHRREISFAMTYVRTAVRRNYRWGYLSDEELDTWIDRLMLPEQAKEWISWAGHLDREYFYRQDLQRLYITQYRNDIITNDSLLVALVAMGIPLRDADMTVRIEKARKSPKITRPVTKAATKAVSDVQKKYVQVYIEQYRKDLITAGQLTQSLLAAGLEPELAEVSVLLQQAKKGLKPPTEFIEEELPS